MLRSVQGERRSQFNSNFLEKLEGHRRNVQCLRVTYRVLFRPLFVSGGAKSSLCLRATIPSKISCFIHVGLNLKDNHYHHS